MRGQSLISIIVPVYNTEPYLRKCVDSILNQTYTNLEIILVDDGSTDKSGEICDEYAQKDSRVIVIHKENGGLSSARNAGLKIATGQYVGFVDSDDMITVDMYQALYEMCKRTNSEAAQVSVTSFAINARKVKSIDRIYRNKEILITYLHNGLQNPTQSYSVCNKLYKKELFDNISFPDGRLYEDYSTNFAVLMRCKSYAANDKACYVVNKSNASITRTRFTKKDYDIYITYDEVCTAAEEDGNEQIVKLAHISRAVSDTHLLYKMVMHGFDETIENPRKEACNLIANLRSNYKNLMTSPLPLRQKIVVTGYCISFRLMKAVAAIYKLTLGGRLAA